MRPAILVGLMALLGRVVVAQAQPDVAEIMKRVSKTYTDVIEYEFVSETRTTLQEEPRVRRQLFAFRVPNQYRKEVTELRSPDDAPEPKDIVMVHDGSMLWTYSGKINQYSSVPADKLAENAAGIFQTPDAMDGSWSRKYRLAGLFGGWAKLLREEEIEVAGVKHDCFVIANPDLYYGPFTWWVDKTSFRVVREDTDYESTTFTTIKLGEALPADLFRFAPPPGAYKSNQN